MKATIASLLTGSIVICTVVAASAATTATAPARTTTRVTDPGTGLVVATTRGVAGTASFELSSNRLSIRKDVLIGRSVTTISEGGEKVMVAIDRSGVVFASSGGVVSAAIKRPEEIARVLDVMARTTPVRDAAALLARTRLDRTTAAGQAIALTRAFLESAGGNRTGTLELVSWVKPAGSSSGARAVMARTGSSPGGCWDAYASEALRIANEYMDCYNSTHWYNVVTRAECGALYDVEAEGAWMWYLNCVGSPIPNLNVS